MRTFTLRNDFHNTSVNVRCQGIQYTPYEIEITLSESQKKRTKKALCGVQGCTCSDETGMRGEQDSVYFSNHSGSARLIVN